MGRGEECCKEVGSVECELEGSCVALPHSPSPSPSPPLSIVADSLIYETTHLITEDYPPGNGQDVLLRYGDRIVEVRSGGVGDTASGCVCHTLVTWLSHTCHMTCLSYGFHSPRSMVNMCMG